MLSTAPEPCVEEDFTLKLVGVSGSSSEEARAVNSAPCAPRIRPLRLKSQLIVSTGPEPIVRLMVPASAHEGLVEASYASEIDPHTPLMPAHHRRPS
jgi:hypothetical protein